LEFLLFFSIFTAFEFISNRAAFEVIIIGLFFILCLFRSNKISSLTNLNELKASSSKEDSFEEILRKQRVFLSNNWYDQIERKR
jgi:hypothetical protein